MRAYRYVTADVFTGRQFGGNPLAVVLDADGLTSEEMLAVTREFNYSETTFVLPAERGGTCRVRIFTPGGEVPFAGHPTVGTAHVLVAAGRVPVTGDETVLVLEEQVGDVPVRVRTAGAALSPLGGPEPTFAELTVAQLPTEGEAPEDARLVAALGLDVADLVGGPWAPRVASCGLPFTLVPVRSRAAVSRARVHADAWARAFPAEAWGRGKSEGVLVFALRDADADAAPGASLHAHDISDGPNAPDAPNVVDTATAADVHARVFVPELAVPEDPATGSACAALAGYLAARTPRLDGTLRWTVDQGVEMGRPSRLALEADRAGGRTTAVRVGGASVLVCDGTIRVRG